jgi:hypothetical protein
MEESQTLHGQVEYRLYSFYLHRSHHRPIKLNAVRDAINQPIFFKHIVQSTSLPLHEDFVFVMRVNGNSQFTVSDGTIIACYSLNFKLNSNTCVLTTPYQEPSLLVFIENVTTI